VTNDPGLPEFRLAVHPGSPEFLPVAIAALHQGNYATIANYSERELRYMDAGE
jgi:hypothetical protein